LNITRMISNWICDCDTIVVRSNECPKCYKRRFILDPAYMYRGKIRTITEWAKWKGMKYQTLYQRLKIGWSIKDALNKKITNAPKKLKRLDY
jgi:hypothetical protein